MQGEFCWIRTAGMRVVRVSNCGYGCEWIGEITTVEVRTAEEFSEWSAWGRKGKGKGKGMVM